LKNKDDFEYIGKPSDLYYWWKYVTKYLNILFNIFTSID
jgi:hypothetical protein